MAEHGPEWTVITNYSNGWVVEVGTKVTGPCESFLLLPAENLWSAGIRGVLYCFALAYIFIGVAIASDIFMGSIEVITSKRRKIIRWDEERQERIERDVLVWNATVANLTLMALGSSAPEILLAVVETVGKLGVDTSQDDGLGTFTIIGSAAFNLLIISAICIVSVPAPQVKYIHQLGVFALTSAWSIFAYLWMLIVLVGITPNEVEPWEAWVTIAFFPIMVVSAYCQDNHWWCQGRRTVGIADSEANLRVVMSTKHGVHVFPRELSALEKETSVRMSRLSLADDNHSVQGARLDDRQTNVLNAESLSSSMSQGKNEQLTLARFRHGTVRSMLGGRKHQVCNPALVKKLTIADVVSAMRTEYGKGSGQSMPSDEEMLGKFTFGSPSYSVLESSGNMEIDILFHRLLPSKAHHLTMLSNNTTSIDKEHETSFMNAPKSFDHTGIVSIEYETREGSAKIDKDFKYTSGTLVFGELEYRKSINIPIINDLQYEADVDFYVILKNPSGESGISDPNITRVTIIDDDEPGEFQFEESHHYANLTTGQISANVIRQKGCDGTVSIEYSTVDGTAKGGSALEGDVDYLQVQGVLTFKHGETTKPIVLDVNKDATGTKNFIVTLRNPSIGAKIGAHTATVCNITSGGRLADNLDERLAEVVSDSEMVTWAGQFKLALSLECDRDDDGAEIPLKWYDYLLHFLSFFWKVFLAFIPPRRYMGAWPTFVISLAVIGLETAIIEQLGGLLGCVWSLKSAVAGITIVALGTSLPDTFASRSAAQHDEGADAAIGNITGSNSVNVFLGLGLPWVIQSIYSTIHKEEFRVKTTNLTQSVVIFSICGVICIAILFLRRRFLGGELGGTNKVVQYGTAIFLILLWLLYITLSSLKTYDVPLGF